MLFKRESDYGIRIVRALKAGKKLPVKEICDLEDIPEAFAYKILRRMQNYGLVAAERGAQGGYTLARELSQITLYDIIVAVESDFNVIPCMHQVCSKNTGSSPCRVHKELSQIQNRIVTELQSRSMAEILGQ